jgi:hypothetical protein
MMMPSPFQFRRRCARIFAALMAAGACSLLGLTAIHALHHMDGHHCPTDLSGDPFDCYVCNALTRVAPAPVLVLVIPAPQPGPVVDWPAPPLRPAADAPSRCAARGPPLTVL